MEQLLEQARDEIRQLRRANEILGAKVEAFETAALFLRSTPAWPMMHGEAEDVTWKLDREIDRLRKEAEAKKEGAGT